MPIIWCNVITALSSVALVKFYTPCVPTLQVLKSASLNFKRLLFNRVAY